MPSATTETPSAAPRPTIASTSVSSTPPSRTAVTNETSILSSSIGKVRRFRGRREPGTEVVERHATTGRSQCAEVLDALFAAVEDDTLGHLEVEGAGGESALAQGAEHVLDEVVLAQLAGGHVDAHPEIRGGATQRVQPGQFCTGRPQRPAAKGDDRTAQRMEWPR